MGTSSLDELITFLAQGLVDRPDQVRLRESSTDAGRTFELQVAPEDVGKVIGRDGRTVNAMRTLVTAAAVRRGEKVRLDILDDRKGAAAVAPPVNGSAAESSPPPAE
ncbi:MAG TPA: KH domain-containing protein [Myxococcaceae bacterium]|nr:KH domain-containing protein [Myxococcaceae bacterium]